MNNNQKRHDLKISVVIPCRKGSTRVGNKNLRKFGNTTLLENKIEILKKSKYLSEIIVSSNDEDALNIAIEHGVTAFKRDDALCVGDVSPAEIHKDLANCISHDVFVYSSPVAPFITIEKFDEIIEFWINHTEHEVVCAGYQIKNYIWKNNQPHNFAIDQGIIPTQNLNEDYKIACADSILITTKNNVIENECIFGDGKNVHMYEINELEGLDIDWNLDFVISESLFHRSFQTIELVDDYMKDSQYEKVMLLDCTIRDTGYLNNWNWEYQTVKDVVYHMGEIGIDYCELGFLMDTKFTEKDCGIWRHINSDFGLIKKIKKETNTKTKISVVFDIGNEKDLWYDYLDIPTQNETGIDLIRVCCYFEIIDKIPDICSSLKAKGYNLTLNVMYASHLSDSEIGRVKEIAKNLPIDFLYFADSIGGLTPKDISRFMMKTKDIYPVKTGFHNHNNHGTVFGNLINLLDCNIDMVDGSISGFGKNGGNSNLEQLLFYIIIKENYPLKIEPLLELLEKLEDVDFGQGFRVDINEIKIMLSQFLSVHPSHTSKLMDYNLLSFYHEIMNLETVKKIR